MNEYKVRHLADNIHEVFRIEVKHGERLSAYESFPDTIDEEKIFQGTLSDCESFIRLAKVFDMALYPTR
jgi:hypothetical protein